MAFDHLTNHFLPGGGLILGLALFPCGLARVRREPEDLHDLTRAWSERVLAIPGLDDGARVRRMYREAFAREPRPDEAAAAAAFLAEGGADAWAAFAHVLANVKEFVFIP